MIIIPLGEWKIDGTEYNYLYYASPERGECMKHLRFVFYVALILLTMLAACAPKPVPTAATVPDTEPPILIPAPTEASATATLTPIILSGPEMKVGSTYQYVDGTLLVAVPAGLFTMGHGGLDNPEHTVTLGDFWIYSTKVTNQQYAFCVKSGQCTTPDLKDNIAYTDFTRLNDPVSGVNYDQAAAYCSFMHGQLPTEAEWEKTARGPDGNIFPWGNNSPGCDLLNFNNCVGKTTSVIKYPQGASYYSALDMEGNTFEWVADWYDFSYYKTGASDNPIGPDKGTQRSVRSTGYKANADQVPASTRFYANPTDHRRDLGFRCVVEDPTWFAPFCSQLSYFGKGPGGGNSGSGGIKYDCPNVSINSQPQSCKDQFTYVTVKDSHSPDPLASIGGLGSCSLISGGPGFPQVYKCTSTTTATIQSLCSFTFGGNAQCGPHYNLHSGTGVCEWDGTGSIGTQCLAGFTYDPASQCCSAIPGSAGSYPLCSVGSTLTEDSPGHYICLPNASAPNPPGASAQVLLPAGCNQNQGCNPATDPTCQSGGCPNGGTYSCTPDPRCTQFGNSCPYGPVCGCH